MPNDIFQVSLWFNSSKAAMREQLKNTNKNSGVGLNILKGAKRYFDNKLETVELEFDDGMSGTARVMKDSWGTCTHLIDECIGEWTRANGLWQAKLTHPSVCVYVQVIEDFRTCRVSQSAFL
jgi:hypothetical protein